MIVAIWAFAIRFATTEIANDSSWAWWTSAAILPPLLLIPVLCRPSTPTKRAVGLTSIYFISIFIFLAVARDNKGPLPKWGLFMAIAQVTYISAWWAMMRMDEAMQERRANSATSREKLAIFVPKHDDE
jgi:hypothetical protein